jgi:predicted RNA-binding protein associated with RNAse of E/G family
VTTWIDRLGRAVTSGLITQTEATAAIRRQQRGAA